MKSIFAILISFLIVAVGYSQTRNVVVGTNNVVVQPTNFWSADASNARSGLGLGSAATNPASAFQPASSTLSNLVSGVALTLTNITIGISNVTDLQSALDGKLSTNPTLFIANISNLQTTLDGKLGTNPTLQISNIAALQTALDTKLTASFPLAISNISGLQTSLDSKLGTNPTLSISNISGLQTNLDSKLSITGNAINLTNFPTVGLASNITGTAPLATNITGVIALVNGGTGATNAAIARTNLGIGSSDVFVALTNLGTGGNRGFSSSPYILGSTNSTAPNNAVLALDSSAVRSVAGLTLDVLTNTSIVNFRSALGLGSAATNPETAFQPSSSVLSNLATTNGASLTNLTASNITGAVSIANGGSGATTAGGARSNLSLDWSALTNSNSATSLLGYTANGQVVANTGTNVLTFTNNINIHNISINEIAIVGFGNMVDFDQGILGGNWEFNNPVGFGTPSQSSITRANLGFSTNLNTLWTATNTSNAITGLFGSGTNPVVYNTNGEVVTPTNFWQNAPIKTTVYTFAPITNASTNISGARNIYVYSLATNIVGVTATINLPTNGTTFNGDAATVIHRGTTSSVTTIKESGNTLISISNYDSAVKFINENGTWKPYHNISYLEPIKFAGTNSALNIAQTRTNLGLGSTNDLEFNSVSINELRWENSIIFEPETGTFQFPINFSTNNNGAAITRTNLGIGATWLTNTNVTNFRTAIGLGETNITTFDGLNIGQDIDITVYGIIGYNAEIDLEEKDLNAGSGYNWNLNGSGFDSAGVITFANTTNANTTRTNLGLGLAALTNTNNASFQRAIFQTNTTPTNGANLGDAKGWIEISVITNSVTNSFRIPVFQ